MKRRWVRTYQNPSDLAAYLQSAELMAQVTGVALSDVTAQGRINSGRTNPRRMAHMGAIYLAVVAKGVPAIRLSRAIGLHRAAVTRICRKCEDLRDRPDMDALFDRLTVMLEAQ